MAFCPWAFLCCRVVRHRRRERVLSANPSSTATTSPATENEVSPWRRAVIDIGSDASEAVQGVLLEENALGIEIDDDETRAMPGRAMAPTGRSTVIATFAREPGLEARVVSSLTPLADFLSGAQDMEISWSDLWPEDWNAAFKAEWKPLTLCSRIEIVPTWMPEYPVPEDREAIYIDPGMAFGTGTHETTQLCAQALDALLEVRPIENLLDVGTGTGILSIAAIKLGAQKATGTEIDPVALQAARENADENGVGDAFVDTLKLPDHWGPSFDVVVANILAEPLLSLAENIVGALRPGGKLILSGLLEAQGDTLRRVYERLGVQYGGSQTLNGWLCLQFDQVDETGKK